jgi:septal ring factor EnvC (AmiA/AmiB activator)
LLSDETESWPTIWTPPKFEFPGGGFEPAQVFESEVLTDFKIGEEWAMRVLIFAFSVLAFSVLGILVSVDAAKAGLSATDRNLSASADPATFADESTQQTEDQIGLDKKKRRDVQRRLTRLGFDTKVNGKFDERTRAVITRWQEARGYPKTGYLNTLQHQALLTEGVSTAQASASDETDNDHRARHRGGGGRHHRGGVGGPVGLIGGMVGGLFGRR